MFLLTFYLYSIKTVAMFDHKTEEKVSVRVMFVSIIFFADGHFLLLPNGFLHHLESKLMSLVVW